MKKIHKILIANRGEITVRIIRTCREMGIKTVAVFSEVDRNAPHVLLADEAYCIGAAAPAESYLNINKIIEVAQKSGAEAIHPGYGFLAENAGFATAVSEAGLIFIGPNPDTIALMGSKTESRKAMIAANVPVVPGTKDALASPEDARKAVDAINGYPVLIKAAAGGGGKGMRIVKNAGELERAFLAAKNEALKSFGDDTVYIEKYIEAPKHIEIQIIADQHGNACHLLERECSIQRRHQKIIEECPSSVISPETREKMGAVAVQAAHACGYVNAGTVEFLYDTDGSFYFLEMNTRLQVEHPVTEEVLGLDLVRLQIMIAKGQALPFTQAEIQPEGVSIECRINAEDVFNNFVPSTGKIAHMRLPAGPGIRVDSGVRSHSEISPFYDSMVAKLVVWAPNRETALARMKRALLEYEIIGIDTTIPFCLAALDHPAFHDGSFTTQFVDLYWAKLLDEMPDETTLAEIAAISIVLHEEELSEKLPDDGSQNGKPAEVLSPWKLQQYRALRSR